VSDDSPAALWVRQLVRDYGAKGAHARLDEIASSLSVVELADLGRAWADFWARPKQRPPAGQWRSWGAIQTVSPVRMRWGACPWPFASECTSRCGGRRRLMPILNPLPAS
jgi:hypothetical protein